MVSERGRAYGSKPLQRLQLARKALEMLSIVVRSLREVMRGLNTNEL